MPINEVWLHRPCLTDCLRAAAKHQWRHSYVGPISVSCEQGILVLREERSDVVKASDLELLRLLLDDLSVQGAHQRRRVQEERPVWKIDLTLTNRGQVFLGERRL